MNSTKRFQAIQAFINRSKMLEKQSLEHFALSLSVDMDYPIQDVAESYVEAMIQILTGKEITYKNIEEAILASDFIVAQNMLQDGEDLIRMSFNKYKRFLFMMKRIKGFHSIPSVVNRISRDSTLFEKNYVENPYMKTVSGLIRKVALGDQLEADMLTILGMELKIATTHNILILLQAIYSNAKHKSKTRLYGRGNNTRLVNNYIPESDRYKEIAVQVIGVISEELKSRLQYDCVSIPANIQLGVPTEFIGKLPKNTKVLLGKHPSITIVSNPGKKLMKFDLKKTFIGTSRFISQMPNMFDRTFEKEEIIYLTVDSKTQKSSVFRAHGPNKLHVNLPMGAHEESGLMSVIATDYEDQFVLFVNDDFLPKASSTSSPEFASQLYNHKMKTTIDFGKYLEFIGVTVMKTARETDRAGSCLNLDTKNVKTNITKLFRA